MTNARERILHAARANQPAAVPLPPVPTFTAESTLDLFAERLTVVGGELVHLPGPEALAATVATLWPAAQRIASALLPGTLPVSQQTAAAMLADVDLAVLAGEFGVAENGAVWLPEAAMLHRALPTITQHLALVLDHRQLVPTMHQAYARLASGPGGYGLFVAGPSKTADIEQSLVVGAHGARSLVVLVV